jgi:hypothetical protein
MLNSPRRYQPLASGCQLAQHISIVRLASVPPELLRLRMQ